MPVLVNKLLRNGQTHESWDCRRGQVNQFTLVHIERPRFSYCEHSMCNVGVVAADYAA
jgi:hypothetical protein